MHMCYVVVYVTTVEPPPLKTRPLAKHSSDHNLTSDQETQGMD